MKRAWSYSALTAFETCPRQFYLLKVAKEVKEEESEAIRWGNEVHKALELRIKDKTPLPREMARYERLVRALEAKPGELLAEEKVAVTEDFEKVAFFDRSVWLRCILDVQLRHPDGRTLFVGDWKTGKRKPDDDQTALFAALSMSLDERLERVVAAYIWLKEDRMDSYVYERAHLSSLWNRFLPRVERLYIAHERDAWPARPSGLCRKWCPVGRSRCEFCGG